MRSFLETDRRLVAPDAPPPRRPWSSRTRWVVGLLALTVFLTAVGFLVADIVHERRQLDRAKTELGVTRDRTTVVAAQLTELRHDVDLLTTQIGNDTTAFDQDSSQLKGVQAALALTQADVSQQSVLIADLHTCLSGVEEALNSLSVGNQAGAIADLNAVSSSCTAASSSG